MTGSNLSIYFNDRTSAELRESYHEERGEARACGDLDFPTYSDWLHNLLNPRAERIRAEERIEIKERGLRGAEE